MPGEAAEVPTLYQPVFYVPRFGRDWMAETYYRSLRDQHVTTQGTNAVFATWLYPDGVVAARLARDLAVPCWIMVQGSDVFHLRFPRRRKALGDVMDAIGGFVCVCRPLAERLVEAGIDRSKVHVVPNGVDGELFRYRTRAEAAEGWTADGGWKAEVFSGRRKLVLFVGNLVPVKGPDVFLKSLARLKAMTQGPWATVAAVIGDGPMRHGLVREARRLGLGDTVAFLGSRPHDEVARWMNVADVLCLTSRSEGMPNVVIEALVSGLPVAVADVGACRELVADEPEARVCLSEDAQGMARAIAELAGAPCDRKAMAARHRERFSWARQARTILGLMRLGGGAAC